MAAWRQRMGTDQAKEIYRQRAATAETVNADAKAHRGLDALAMRGLGNVAGSAALFALPHSARERRAQRRQPILTELHRATAWPTNGTLATAPPHHPAELRRRGRLPPIPAQALSAGTARNPS